MGQTRHTLKLSEKDLLVVERLADAYGFNTKAEVYELGMRVLSWMTEQQANGHEFGRHKNGEFEPLLVPCKLDGDAWRNASPKTRSQKKQKKNKK